MAVLGPSGCGKSTLLTIIAGLEEPDQGQMFWNSENRSRGCATHQRGFGLMFQDFALFPHLDVYENVAFGLTDERRFQRKKSNPGCKRCLRWSGCRILGSGM